MSHRRVMTLRLTYDDVEYITDCLTLTEDGTKRALAAYVERQWIKGAELPEGAER